MNWKPKKWIAALLGFFSMPIGMLYVAQPLWAGIYLAAALVIVSLEIVLLHRYFSPLQLEALTLVLPTICAFHAARFAERFDELRSRPWYSRWFSLVGGGVFLLLLMIGNRAFLYESFRYPGGSMLPSIPPGAYVIAQKWGYGHYSAFGISIARVPISSPLKRGDVIIFEFPAGKSTIFAQRLIGLPGDTISYKGKQLSINGQQVERRQVDDFMYIDPFFPLRFSSQYIERIGDAEYRVLAEKNVSAYGQSGPLFSTSGCRYVAEELTCEVPAGHYFMMVDNRDNGRDSRFWGFLPADHVIGKVVYPVVK